MNNINLIEINQLEKSFGIGKNRLNVLKGINLSVSRGEIVSIVGPSGTGKSTLLNLIGCLDNFERGSLKIIGKDVSDFSIDELSNFRNIHMGFIFQLHNLLPEFNAIENIMMPLLIRRMNKKKAREMSMDILDRFGLANRSHHNPGELSGGECQRVAVARAIVGEPDIILADEPTGSLDSQNSMILMNMLIKLCREKNSTAIIITHDLKIANMADRTISMLDGLIVEKDS